MGLFFFLFFFFFFFFISFSFLFFESGHDFIKPEKEIQPYKESAEAEPKTKH